MAAEANYTYPISESIEASMLAEWACIHNVGGASGDINYLTTSFGLTIEDAWNATLSYTGRYTDVTGWPDEDDYLFQASAGYVFENGITVDGAYRKSEEAGVNTGIFCGLAAYIFEF